MSDFLNPTPWVPTNKKEATASKPTLSKRLIASIAGSVLIGAALATAIVYPIAQSNGASSAAVQEKKADLVKMDEDYQELQENLEAAQQTIASADTLQSGIDDLTQKHDELQQQVDALSQQKETLDKSTVSTGVWQVGRDIDAGTYRAAEPVSEDCYWEISANDDIVNNDIPGGGYPQATVSAGQQLTLRSCGTWTKQ